MNIFVLFVPQSVYIVQNTTFTDVFGSTTLAIINFLKHKHVHGAASNKLQESIRWLIRYWHSKFGWLVGYFLYLYPTKMSIYVASMIFQRLERWVLSAHSFIDYLKFESYEYRLHQNGIRTFVLKIRVISFCVYSNEKSFWDHFYPLKHPYNSTTECR